MLTFFKLSLLILLVITEDIENRASWVSLKSLVNSVNGNYGAPMLPLISNPSVVHFAM